MTAKTRQTVEYVWEDLEDSIEYEKTSVYTVDEGKDTEITVRLVEFGDDEACEIVSSTINEDDHRLVSEITFYYSKDKIHSFKNKTIEQSINLIMVYPDFDVIDFLTE